MKRWVVIIAISGLIAAMSAFVWISGYYDRALSQSSDHFRSKTGPVPATPQRPGDEDAGYYALVNEPYVNCGMPYSAYRRFNPEIDPDDLLPEREDRNAELPYAFTSHVNADGVEIVSSNCLLCHASRFNGKLVVGLGNEFLDFTQDPRRIVNQVGSYVQGDAESAAWQRWADRVDGIAPYIQTQTVGVNPATNLTWALMAHRNNKTLEWSSEPLIEPPPTSPLPVSVPPWWRMQKKNAMFYTTIGRGDHSRFMIMASLLCADSIAEVEVVDAYGPDIRAYLESLRPPPYPYPVDVDLAEEGRGVFEDNCSRCHGTYGEDGTYPNLVVPLDEIDTDNEYALAATDGRRDRFYQWVESSYYGNSVQIAPARGYIAPPLDGVWATAPYLHNGSVPDIQSLLDSSTRPDFWRHRVAPRDYDPSNLGWRYDRLEQGKADVNDPEMARQVYDTTLPGYGNDGHEFGDHLSNNERKAVLEYLKTL
ncbi:c-type cytochrome [Ruegeria lacuscaerulensis]|uniref:c-type cytochrome n=1 Tax=Ruegeria lacuscaerulensis TaxID=55218 RepID=UPI001BE46AA8|nr:c-type cytochrome [Ruegeria lacuscaerulensis]